MKQCPACHRTYADETLTYCLADGTLLSAPYDPQATQRITPPRNTDPPPTEVFRSNPPPPEPTRAGINPRFVYGVIISMAVLIVGLIAFIALSNSSQESRAPQSRGATNQATSNTSASNTSNTAAPIKPVVVRVYNVDDLATVHVNGSQSFQVLFNSSKQVDITNYLRPGKNEVRLVIENFGKGYAYGFEIYKNNQSIFKQECGEVNVNGCRNEDFRTGIIYDETVVVDSN